MITYPISTPTSICHSFLFDKLIFTLSKKISPEGKKIKNKTRRLTKIMITRSCW